MIRYDPTNTKVGDAAFTIALIALGLVIIAYAAWPELRAWWG